MAALKRRVRPRLARLRLRGVSGMLGMRPALKILFRLSLGNYLGCRIVAKSVSFSL